MSENLKPSECVVKRPDLGQSGLDFGAEFPHQPLFGFASDIVDRTREAEPFLKWAGGKSQLLCQFEPFFPTHFDRYVEPFLGGGAVFFHIKARTLKIPACLCDNNGELINCYRVVRDQPEALMKALDKHLERFLDDRKTYYYRVRAQHALEASLDRAARMIFLNRTCFNGLWRVNSSGKFNVPMGSYKSVKLYEHDNLVAVSNALRGVELLTQDFRKTLAGARPGDFVYIDPPYHPISPTAYFTAYTKDDFGPKEQQELALMFYSAARRGANLMLSNSDTPAIRELYKHYKIHSVQARRMINAQGQGRGAISELVILGYTKEQYTRMLNNSARAWLFANGYADIARLIDEILLDWEKRGKRTRRNWWDVLAGKRNGAPMVIEGRTFPVLKSARLRQGLPVTKDSLCRDKDERVPRPVEQTRWRKGRKTKYQRSNSK